MGLSSTSMSKPQGPPRPDKPTTTAQWLRRFADDMAAQGFTPEATAALLPTVLAHLLRSDDLLTEAE